MKRLLSLQATWARFQVYQKSQGLTQIRRLSLDVAQWIGMCIITSCVFWMFWTQFAFAPASWI